MSNREWLTAILRGRSESWDRIAALARRSGRKADAVKNELVRMFRLELVTVHNGKYALARTRLFG